VSRVRYQASFILDDCFETKGAPHGPFDHMSCRKSQDEHWLRSSHEFDNCSSATTPLCLCAVFNAYPDRNMNSILKWTIRALGGSRLLLVRVKPAIVSSETKVEEERLLGYGPKAITLRASDRYCMAGIKHLSSSGSEPILLFGWPRIYCMYPSINDPTGGGLKVTKEMENFRND